MSAQLLACQCNLHNAAWVVSSAALALGQPIGQGCTPVLNLRTHKPLPSFCQSDEDCIADDDDDEGYPYEGMDQDTDAGAGSDGSGEGGSEEEEDDEDERDLMIACGRRQGAWERFEERLKEAEAAAGPSGVGGRGGAASASVMGLSHEEASAKKQQIFEPREAFMMLSKELLDILRRRSYDMIVDSVGDDVYCWSVELASFDADSDIAKVCTHAWRDRLLAGCALRLLLGGAGGELLSLTSLPRAQDRWSWCLAMAVDDH